MASIKDRAAALLVEVRSRRPLVDHVVRMQQHYGNVKGGQQAGAVTYFGFLSFFPIMALAFFVVGYISSVYPEAHDQLTKAIDSVLPGLIGNDDGQVQLSDIEDAAGAVGLIGLLGVLYAGLGWVSALRDALVAVFEEPKDEQPGFVQGKLRDLAALAMIGTVLILAVAVTGFVSGFSDDVLDFLHIDAELGWLVRLITVVLGLAANTVLFFAMFELLADPQIPRRAVWSGALLGSLAFEVLKQISGVLVSKTQGQPAFQAFGIALILLVWINYFSRVVLYSAAWSFTSREARALHSPLPAAVPPDPGPLDRASDSVREDEADRTRTRAAFAVGATAGVALAAVLKKKPENS